MAMNPRDYERMRQANIESNKALLASLGLEKPLIEPKQTKRPAAPKKAPATKKRSAPASDATSGEESSDERRPKVQRVSAVREGDEDGPGPRRSGRNAGKSVDYKSENANAAGRVPKLLSIKDDMNAGPEGRAMGKRKYDPKTYGSIPGIEIGTWWQTREGCSIDAIHASWVGGITCGPQGAYSVALSGGYEDDVDLGYAFTYTGSGGRDLKGTKQKPKNLRTAPQSSDQTFENNFNKALQRSSETKKPVRVIRGFKLKSKYAPSEGYRYDGLYTVEKAWLEPGMNPKGYLVCKFALKRLPGQKPLEVKDEDETQEGEEDGGANGEDDSQDGEAEADGEEQEE